MATIRSSIGGHRNPEHDRADGAPIRACALESFPDPTDGVQVRLSARDPEGNLAGYTVPATGTVMSTELPFGMPSGKVG